MPAEVVDVTEDSVLDGRIRLLQPATGYRAAIDPVFLAAAIPAACGQLALDVGCGVGAVGLCLAVRVPGLRVFGLELQPGLAALARDNVAINGLHGRVEILTGPIGLPPPRLAPGSFDHVFTNPPFLAAEAAAPTPDASKHAANVEGEADLAQWLKFCLTMVRPKGTVTLIHRADRLGEILALLHGRAGDVSVFPLWPKVGRPAKRVIVRARKHIQSPLQLLPGLVLHEACGRYTAAAEAVLRGGAGL